MRPAAQWLSFASPKESHQRKGDPTRCVPSLRCGQPAVLSFAGVSLNSRRFASLKQTRALIRQNLRSSAHPEGNPKTGQPHGPLLRSAGTARAQALRAAQTGPSEAMARLAVWLFGCLDFGPPTPSGCACGGVFAGWHARRSAHASSSDSPWFSSAARQRVASSTEHPANTPTQVCPEGVADCRVAFLLGTFLWRSKEQVPRQPGRDPASKLRNCTKRHHDCTDHAYYIEHQLRVAINRHTATGDWHSERLRHSRMSSSANTEKCK